MATYENANQLAVSWRYKAKSSSTWVGETWSNTLRLWPNGGGPRVWGTGRTAASALRVADAANNAQTDLWDIEYGWDADTGGPSMPNQAQQDSVVGAVSTYLQAIKAYFGNIFVLDSVRLYPLDAVGKTLTNPSIYYPRTIVHQGTSNDSLPPDVSLAISWQTPSRGPSGRGRIFLGGLNDNVRDTTGLITVTAQDDLRTASVALITNCVAAYTDPLFAEDGLMVPSVWTRNATKSGQAANTVTAINEVRTSDEFDTQRRRDRQRVDVYRNTIIS